MSAICLHCPETLKGQITSAAQGGKLATWAAFGLNQQLSENWSMSTNAGYGRHSDPNNNELMKRQGIGVIKQDFIYKHGHWRYSVSAGYWRRNYYRSDFPYNEQAFPYEFRNEFRTYQKAMYDHTLNMLKMTHTLRTEQRFYENQDLSNTWKTPLELRLRYNLNIKLPLTSSKKNWIILINEVFGATDKNINTSNSGIKNTSWTNFRFTENRLSLFYRYSLSSQKIDIDFGIMDQYWRNKPGSSIYNTTYTLMCDIILKNPFSKKEIKNTSVK